MVARTAVVLVAIAAFTAAPACGQFAPAVVQLPTFSFFTVQTSVLVPDSGGAYVGGMYGSRSSWQRFHLPLLPGQSAVGRDQFAHGVGVTATIHDHEPPAERTDGVLRLTQSRDGSTDPFAQRLAAAAGSDLPRGGAARREQAVSADREAMRFLSLGDRARDDGKLDVAKVYYHMAARRATGAQAGAVAARIDGLRELVSSKVAQADDDGKALAPQRKSDR